MTTATNTEPEIWTGVSPRKRVQVLLATCNGQRFLKEQLDSLFAQTYPHFSILASDDGSTDGTCSLLEEYAGRYPDRLLLCPNRGRKGPVGNFTSLLEQSDAPYVAFSDQDDVWFPNKLDISMNAIQAVEAGKGASVPLLVYTDMQLIDDAGGTLAKSHWKKAGVHPARATFRHLLAQNLATGCSVLANRALISRALPIPVESAIMHDYWLVLIAAAFGAAVALEEPTFSYRQHDHNVVGAGAKLSLVRRVKRVWTDPQLEAWIAAASSQAAAFLRRYGEDLSIADRSALEVIVELPHKSRSQRNWHLLRAGIRRTGIRNHLQWMLRL